MKRTVLLLFCVIFLSNCKEMTTDPAPETVAVEFNQELVDELNRMATVDQIAADIPKGIYKELSSAQWQAFKDSVFTTHEKKLQEIFREYGFLGYDLVGRAGSSDFWVMVQHSDHNPSFQTEVLEKMKIEVDKGNADSSIYGLLVDRVKLNTGKAQVYGTQVTYNKHTGQAYPKKLADSAGVNERRKLIGLEPLEEYLNGMSTMHFEINKEGFTSKGITEPKLYPTQ